jgi:hypothetical protein
MRTLRGADAASRRRNDLQNCCFTVERAWKRASAEPSAWIMLVSLLALVSSPRASAAVSCNASHDERAAEQALNTRFSLGRPSGRFHSAGVVLRGYDADVRLHPPTHPRWITEGPSAGVASASLINAHTPFLFAGNSQLAESIVGQMGVVITSHAAHATLACAYPGDAASVYVRCDANRPSKDCVAGCIGIRLLPGATPSTLTRQHWCDSGSGGASGLGGECDGAGCRGGCAWRPEALATVMQIHENTTSVALAGCPSTRHRWCGCVGHGKSCCTYPRCTLYNELILSSQALDAYEGHEEDGVKTGAFEAVYYLERSASASGESYARAEAAARDLQRALRVTTNGCEREDGAELANSNARHSHSSRPADVSPILVAIDLSREHPFRLAG